MRPRELFAIIVGTALTVALGIGSIVYGKWLGENVSSIAEGIAYTIAIGGVGGAWFVIVKFLMGDKG